MTGTKHSKYPPSSAFRWLNCPASVLLSPDDIEEDTTAAKEGTLAHKIAELKLTADFWNDNKEELEDCRSNPLYKPEMEKHTDNYLKYIDSNKSSTSKVFVETELDLSKYMPGLFGTCDCIIYDNVLNRLDIIDFKYGFGKVECKDNPQLMFYALGAIDFIKNKFPEINLEDVTITVGIYQPRIQNINSNFINYKDLKKWLKRIKPQIDKVLNQKIERNTGDWCKWCDRQIHCREYQHELMDCYVEDFFSLSDLEISLNLERLADIEKLLKKLKAYAVKQIKAGHKFPGYKLHEVNKKSWKNEEAVNEIATENGLMIIPSPNQALKKLGKKKFDELLGDQVTTTPGTPQLKKER